MLKDVISIIIAIFVVLGTVYMEVRRRKSHKPSIEMDKETERQIAIEREKTRPNSRFR